jgi:hypothetical protein
MPWSLLARSTQCAGSVLAWYFTALRRPFLECWRYVSQSELTGRSVRRSVRANLATTTPDGPRIGGQ